MTNKQFFLKVLKYLLIFFVWVLTMVVSGMLGAFIGREELKEELKRTHSIDVNY